MLNAASHKPQASGFKLAAACGLWLVACGPFVVAQDSLNMQVIGHWSDDALPASDLYDNTYNAVWGYVRDGREYGIIGSTNGTHIIEVTDAPDLVQRAFIPGAVQGGEVIHREYKTYEDRLYCVTDEGPGTLQIVDLRWLPDSAPVNYDSHDLFFRAHTIWIDTLNARLYTHAGNTDFAIWSLADPDEPILLLKPQFTVPWWNNVGVVHDAYTRYNICYLNDIDAMHIIDFTNLAAPVVLGSLTNYPQAGYNHSGWLHDNGWLYVMADETHGTDLKLFDVSDPGDIQFIDTIGTTEANGSIPHNPCFQGDLLHVAWYEDGYWLWSVADPANAQLLGYYDMHPEPYSFSYKGAWGVYPYLPSGKILISEMQHGLFVIDISQALGLEGGKNIVAADLTIAPNPAVDATTISWPHDLGAVKNIQVIDVQGRVVLNTATGRTTGMRIDTRNFAPGMYTVVVRTNDRTLTARLMKADER